VINISPASPKLTKATVPSTFNIFSHIGSITCSAFLAHSKNELMQWHGVHRPSVRQSVNFCANRFFSHKNGRIATKLAHDGLRVQGVLKVKVNVKGHVIRTLSCILGMSYSVIDGLVIYGTVGISGS